MLGGRLNSHLGANLSKGHFSEARIKARDGWEGGKGGSIQRVFYPQKIFDGRARGAPGISRRDGPETPNSAYRYVTSGIKKEKKHQCWILGKERARFRKNCEGKGKKSPFRLYLLQEANAGPGQLLGEGSKSRESETPLGGCVEKRGGCR